MQIKKRLLIIGLMITIGLAPANALALYSPRLSQKVAEIQQHVLSSQGQNGTGTVLSTVEFVKDRNAQKRANQDETGISGEARQAQDLVLKSNFDFLVLNPYYSIMMIFNRNTVNNEWISVCLRDEIWGMEALRDLVSQEMIKAYIMLDTFHGNLLLADYQYINTHLTLLRKYGSNKTAEFPVLTPSGVPAKTNTNKYFFGIDNNDPNYYSDVTTFFTTSNPTGCPESEFQEAFREVANSFEVFKVLASGRGDAAAWGNIWAMAKANARIRAKQWIAANQISLTIGGESGARQQSLIKGGSGGWDRFVGDFKTQLQVAKNMVGPVTPLFDKKIWQTHTKGRATGIKAKCTHFDQQDEIFRDCTEDQIEQYKLCTGNKEEKAQAEFEGIRCDRYATVYETTSALNLLNQKRANDIEHERTLEEVETAFVYSMTMDSVAESAIKEFDAILFEMNGAIDRGYKRVGNEPGAIPTLTSEVAVLSKRQCGGQQK